ncbi:MAG: hypothetical protein ACC645_27640, partial [Pirellulales bacterium]
LATIVGWSELLCVLAAMAGRLLMSIEWQAQRDSAWREPSRKCEVREDAHDRRGIADHGEYPSTSAAIAPQDVDQENPLEQDRPRDSLGSESVWFGRRLWAP